MWLTLSSTHFSYVRVSKIFQERSFTNFGRKALDFIGGEPVRHS